jgi:hypothetical protein
MAAVTHGLRSRRVLLGNEPEEEFGALRDLLVDHFQPRDPYQADLVEQLVAARWRLERVLSMETSLLEVQIARHEPEIRKEFQGCGYEIRNALAFRALFDESGVLSGLSRYESRFRRACDKLTKKLDALRPIQKLHEEPNSPSADPCPLGSGPSPSDCPPSPSEPDVAQALEPTPEVPQPPDLTAKRTTPGCLSDGRQATSDERPRQRPPEVALC